MPLDPKPRLQIHVKNMTECLASHQFHSSWNLEMDCPHMHGPNHIQPLDSAPRSQIRAKNLTECLACHQFHGTWKGDKYTFKKPATYTCSQEFEGSGPKPGLWKLNR